MNSSFCSERWNECLGLLDTCESSRRECKQDLSNEESDYEAFIQRNLDAPMPWIGLYIAAASAICSLVMAADVFSGLKRKKLWFPCKYFSLNATSLTLLTVTMKLTVDLTSMMTGSYEVSANLASLVLMSTAMGNFMTSVASMDKNDVLLNLTALGILVVTIAINVCIRNDVIGSLVEEIIAIVSMLVLVVVLCFSSMVVPTTKRYIESKYQEMHRIASNGRTDVAKSSVDELKLTLRRYWVMAETGAPQFVLARSVISGTSGLMCLLATVTLMETYVPNLPDDSSGDSDYKWSIGWIMHAQFVGVALGTIAPLMRWYVATWFKISEIGQKRFKDEFKIEKYWTSRMMEWRARPLPAWIRHHKCRKLLHQAKKLLLYICTGVMIFFVLTSKMVIFISARILKAIFFCFHHIKHLKAPNSRDVGVLESRDAVELDLIPYVLLLEGEAKLPERILRNICNELDELIKRGEMKKFKNLMMLLNKSENFNGVKEFDRNEVPSLYSREPPNCWSLPLVTLTSIAITLPNITIHEIDQLVSGVSEGLSLVKIIEKTLDRTAGVKTAADAVWVGVKLHRKWQDKDLQNTSLRGVTDKETLQNLSNLGEKIVKDFTKIEDIVMQNPLNWPSNITAANSMYRIAQTILLDKTHQTDRNLFDRISVMIADILAASLTNLAHVIIFKCHNKTIKDRQESVRQAAVLLGESREILQLLQQRDLPCLDPEKAANIEEWRASMVHP